MSDLGRAACVARDAAGSKPRISFLEIMMYLRRWPTPGRSIMKVPIRLAFTCPNGAAIIEFRSSPATILA